MKKYMDFKDIVKIIAESAKKTETVKIFYPKTENTREGWREVEPYSFSTDIGQEGEHLVYGQDRLSPGHIFNAYTSDSKDDHCDSFIIGKIKSAKPTKNKFLARNGWKIEF